MQSSAGKASGSRKAEWQKGKKSQGGVGVVSATTGTAAGLLPIHALSTTGLSAVSLPSCMTNEFSNASQPKKLWVPAFIMNKEQQCHFSLQAEEFEHSSFHASPNNYARSEGHKTSDEKRKKQHSLRL